MSFIWYICILHLIYTVVQSRQLTSYTVEIKTSGKLLSGTDDNILIQLFGTDAATDYKMFYGTKGLETDDLDQLDFLDKDIGFLKNVHVTITKNQGFRIDWWRLSWVQVSYNQKVYRGIFDETFTSDGEVNHAYKLKLVHCPAGYDPSHSRGIDPVKERNVLLSCKDRNECKKLCNGPSQICENYPGSYKCNCTQGYHMAGSQCEDDNECIKSSTCSNLMNSQCINKKGTYACECKVGFKKIGGKCEDINECAPTLHRCMHMCENTVGSYKCKCRKGWKLNTDERTCIQADECASDPCDKKTSTCYNTNNGAECFCKPGYISVKGQPNLCVPRKCGSIRLYAQNIDVYPPSCKTADVMTFGSKCTFTCKPGYKFGLQSTKELECDRYGTWAVPEKHFFPYCVPTLCPPIKNINKAYIVPQSCLTTGMEHGGSCHIFCENGYKLYHGPNQVKCNNLKFDDKLQHQCVPLPTIECPNAITVNLPEDKNRTVIGDGFRSVVTNVNDKQVTSAVLFAHSKTPEHIVGCVEDYMFPIGTGVIYTRATNRQDHVGCTYTVTVKDTSAPVIKFCPKDLHVSTKTRSAFVQWKEPEFVDNTGIKTIHQSTKNKQTFPAATHTVTYTATDHFNNIAICKFKVFVTVKKCSFKTVAGGDQIINPVCYPMGLNSFCNAQCASGKTFDVAPEVGLRSAWWCYSGDWAVKSMPNCVDIVPGNTKNCPKGTIKSFDYRKQSGGAVCVKCPRGTKYVNGGCQVCENNFYQDAEGQFDCKRCKRGFGTVKNNTIFATDCTALCLPGHYSEDGFLHERHGCIPCPKDTFNSQFGVTACTKCPPYTSTRMIGISNITDCIPERSRLTITPSKSIEAAMGDTVSFSCEVEGFHQPSDIFWLGNLNKPASPRHTQLRNTTRTSKYTIVKARVTDTGDYTCVSRVNGLQKYVLLKLRVTDSSEGSGGDGASFY